jgi:acyl-CoA synthetase (AMP-forming)/AMP-acid ligase II
MLMHQLLVESAERRPDAPAFTWVDRQRSLSYAQAVATMERFAGALHHLGIGKGDRVTIVAHNGLDYLMALFGCWRVGAIAALVNVKFVDELEYYFGDHTPSAVVYTHDIAAAVRRAAAAVRSVRHLVCMDGPQEGALGLPELLQSGFAPPADPRDETAIAHLSYTSGTTGKPKGACLRHEPTVRATRCIAERLQIWSDDVSFGPTALSSSYQLVGNLLPQVGRGAHVQVMGRWTQAGGWDAIEAAGATMMVGNPPFLQDLLSESRARGRKPGALRLVLSGGGPVPPTLKQAWRDELRVPLVESYGQSELGGFVALGRPMLEPDDAKLMRIGPPLPDKEVRIAGPDDQALPPGQIGEIVLRGGFMWGYWGRPEKTVEATRGGWLRTGDIGMIDRDGQITMRGRASELIAVAGRNWYPRDIEEALCRQPNVRQAALVGIKDAALGARPIAFVTLEAPGVDPAKLKQAIRSEVDYDLAPLTITIVEELPMTPTGKIAKAELAERASRSLAAAQ